LETFWKNCNLLENPQNCAVIFCFQNWTPPRPNNNYIRAKT